MRLQILAYHKRVFNAQRQLRISSRKTLAITESLHNHHVQASLDTWNVGLSV